MEKAKLKLLIIEDDRLLQEAIADYFRSKGWQTDTADDGETALDQIKTKRYHLLLLYDYVTKPFSLPVLYAKAMALMGRVRGRQPDRRMRCGKIEADIHTHEVWIAGASCVLPPKEYDMLLFFMENPNRIFSREQLLIRFWGYDFEGNERVVDNHIKNLRKALGNCGCMIRTVRKSGYRMEVNI